MRRNVLISLIVLLSTAQAFSQTDEEQTRSYSSGDVIDPGVTIVDGEGKRHRLLDLADEDTQVLYLVVFGGPSLNENRTKGGLWCEDSFNDMPTTTYLQLKYEHRGVRFVPVVCPPVYHEKRFAYEEGAFLKSHQSSAKFNSNFEKLVNASTALQDNEVLPFARLYYDPQFQLLFNFDRMPEMDAYKGGQPPWLGKFKPEGDSQVYSTPTIWLIAPDGLILAEPFYGNRYNERTQRIRFTVLDVEAALESALKAVDSSSK